MDDSRLHVFARQGCIWAHALPPHLFGVPQRPMPQAASKAGRAKALYTGYSTTDLKEMNFFLEGAKPP
jgi:hypothetical protein